MMYGMLKGLGKVIGRRTGYGEISGGRDDDRGRERGATIEEEEETEFFDEMKGVRVDEEMKMLSDRLKKEEDRLRDENQGMLSNLVDKLQAQFPERPDSKKLDTRGSQRRMEREMEKWKNDVQKELDRLDEETHVDLMTDEGELKFKSYIEGRARALGDEGEKLLGEQGKKAEGWMSWAKRGIGNASGAVGGAVEKIKGAPGGAMNWARKKGTDVMEGAKKKAMSEAERVGNQLWEAAKNEAEGFYNKKVDEVDDLINASPGETVEERAMRKAGVTKGTNKWKEMSTKEKASKGAQITGGTIAASMVFTDLLPGIAQVIEASTPEEVQDIVINYGAPDAPEYTYGGGMPYVPASSSTPSSSAPAAMSASSRGANREIAPPMALNGSSNTVGGLMPSSQPNAGAAMPDPQQAMPRPSANKSGQGMGVSDYFNTYNTRSAKKRQASEAFIPYSGSGGYKMQRTNNALQMPTIQTALNKTGSGYSFESILQQTGLNKTHSYYK